MTNPFPSTENLSISDGRMPKLRWKLASEHRSLSWAIIGGGMRPIDELIWLQVRNSDLPEDVCPKTLVQEQFTEGELAENKLVFLTSAYLEFYQDVTVQVGDVEVRAIATTGLGNALRAGDPIGEYEPSRTIILACRINKNLSDSALIEAMVIMSEAKAAALMDGQILSRVSGKLATGTGTDCQAVVSTTKGPIEDYAGKHTAIGSAIGQACYEVIRRGIEVWNETEAGRAQRKANERMLMEKGL